MRRTRLRVFGLGDFGGRGTAPTFALGRTDSSAPRDMPHYAMSTLITLVVPGMFTAVPAVMTTRSPL